MANDYVGLRGLIERCEDIRVEIAVAAMKGKNAPSYENFLIAVGKCRQLEAMENSFKDKLKKRPAEDENLDDEHIPEEQRLNEDDEQPEREPVLPRQRARPWGGR